MRLLMQQQPGIEIQGEAADSRGVVDWVSAICPDVLLLDWDLPGMPMVGLIDTLGKLCPQLSIVALSSRPEAKGEALAVGVERFVSKGDPPQQLLTALTELMRGGEKQVLSGP
jgi:DNA-binding NarL/FixJ family response regulator